jgi:hypothetical protein
LQGVLMFGKQDMIYIVAAVAVAVLLLLLVSALFPQ